MSFRTFRLIFRVGFTAIFGLSHEFPSFLGALDIAASVMEPDKQPTFVQGLQDSMQATGNILARLMEGKGSYDARDQVLIECQKAQSEVYPLLSKKVPELTS